MKVLILHAHDIKTQRRAVFNQSFFLPKYAPEHQYSFQCLGHHIPKHIHRGKFDIILIDCTFLCYRWVQPRSILYKIKEDYDFVRTSNAVKIAMPQDDFDHSDLLDNWLIDWGIDILLTPYQHLDNPLLPKTIKNARVLSCYTGHIDLVDVHLLQQRRLRSLKERSCDVGYRATKLPFNFGKFGQLKWEIAECFLKSVATFNHDFKLDISTDSKDVFFHEQWLDFLSDCKAVLGVAGGSSLIDHNGSIQQAVKAYLKLHHKASYEEVKAACFPTQEVSPPIAVISPRFFESGIAGCAQILVPSPAFDMLEAWSDYIPLHEDCGNICEVFNCLKEVDYLQKISTSCFNKIMENESFMFSNLTDRIFQTIHVSQQVYQEIPLLIENEKDILSILKKNELNYDQHDLYTKRPVKKSIRKIYNQLKNIKFVQMMKKRFNI